MTYNDKDQKEIIKKISLISGISEEVIKEVWEKFIFEELCQIAQSVQNNNSTYTLKIPFIGNVLINLNSENSEDGISCYISLNSFFKNLLLDLKKNKIDTFSKIMSRQFSEVLGEIVENNESFFYNEELV